MSGVLGTTPQPEGPLPVPVAPPASAGETWQASRILARGDRTDAAQERLWRNYEPILDEINADRARRGLAPFYNPGRWQVDGLERAASLREGFGAELVKEITGDRVTRDQQQALIFAELRAIRRRDPAFLKGVPDTADAFGKEIVAREQAYRTAARATLERSSGVGNALVGFGGSVFETMHDPVNLYTLPLGGGGKTLASQIGKSLLVNGLLEAAQQPIVAENRAALGEDLTAGEALANVGYAAAGGVLGDVVLPRLGKAGLDLAGKAVDAIDPTLGPGLALRLAQLPDEALTARFTEAVPPALHSFDERAALAVLTREAEVRASSPFVGGAGAEAHAGRLGAAMDALIHSPGPEAPALGRVGAEAGARLPSAAMQYRTVLGLEGGLDRTGRFRTSPAGAIGPAQLMPATAPEAARLAGVPFDEARFRSDADYNRQLGEAYFRDQLRRFGDPDKAAAAYNAGAGRLRDALEKAARDGNPDDWLRHMPAETQAYVRDFRERLGLEPSGGAPLDESGRPVERPAAMDAERPAMAGQPEIDVPELRRDLLPDEASWAIAQARADAQALGIAPIAADRLTEARRAAPPLETMRRAATVSEARAAIVPVIGIPIRNAETGLEATISRGTADKIASQSAVAKSTSAADHALALANVDELFTRARLFESGPDKRGEPTIAAIHRYHAPMETPHGPVEVRMTVKETVSSKQPNPLYTLETLETGKAQGVEPASVPKGSASAPVETRDVAPAGSGAENGASAAARQGELFSRAAADEVAPSPGEDPRALDPFDDPAGEGAASVADSLTHDLRAQLAALPPDTKFRLEDGSEVTAAHVLADLEADDAALQQIKDCL